jgi:hypothetical protein
MADKPDPSGAPLAEPVWALSSASNQPWQRANSSRDRQQVTNILPPMGTDVTPADDHEQEEGQEPPLSLVKRITYALPAFSTTSLTILISLYANDFYGTIIELAPGPHDLWMPVAVSYAQLHTKV